MKNLFSCVLFVIMVLTISPTLGQIAGSFEFEGDTRHYNVYLPQNFHSNMPLILSLHGYSEPLDWYEDYTLMHQFADTSGYVIVFPEGSFAPNGVVGWNNGLRGHSFGRTDTTSNDVGFISALIDTIKAIYNIDLSRIYSCGFSMGGTMSNRIAIELSHRIAAIANVAGNLNDIIGNINVPLHPIPVLHIHGTLDQTVLYWSGQGNVWSVPQTLNYWILNNNCALTPDTIAIPDTCISDSCTVQKISYANCADSAKIIHYKIIRGGHTWPGADTSIWAGGGFLNRDINASQEIVNFFKNYTNPLVNIAWTKNAEIVPAGYFPTQGDTLFIKAYTVNPQNHSVRVIAKILGTGTAFTDSIILYDDGMHGDENPNDNIYGNSKFLSGIPEDQYFVDIYTDDLTEGTSQKYRKLNYLFLTKGPVVLDHYRITSSDTIPHHGDRLKFEFALRNDGISSTVNNITSQVVALDTFSIVYPQTITQYGNIPAGSIVVGSGKQYIEFDLGSNINVDSMDVKFRVDISSNNQIIWSDTFSVFVFRDPAGIELLDQNYPTKYALKQNYPNPFNPTTTIEFSIPETEFVTLIIYNLLGQEVVTLVSEKLKAESYIYSWDAGSLASGVYLYHLQAGGYTKTQKMILLK